MSGGVADLGTKTIDQITELYSTDLRRMDLKKSVADMSLVILNVTNIWNLKTGDQWIIDHQKKVARRKSKDDQKETSESNRMAKEKIGWKQSATIEWKDTGKREKVGAYDTQVLCGENDTAIHTVWVAPELKAFQARIAPVHDAIIQLNPYAKDVGFPLGNILGFIVKERTEFKPPLPLQGVVVTTTLVSIRERNIDSKEFEPPAGYAVIEN